MAVITVTGEISADEPGVTLRNFGLLMREPQVTGTGYYRQAFHPPETATMTVDQIEEKRR